tara:strand:+ start:242 stop:445 length:204 start_codon:yes stop_codon:yes gene_type:complete
VAKITVKLEDKEVELQTDDFTEEQAQVYSEVLSLQREVERSLYISSLLNDRKLILLKKLIGSDEEET